MCACLYLILICLCFHVQELMVTDSAASAKNPTNPQSVFLLEKEKSFSSASPFQTFLATCLAGLNLVGALSLGRVVQDSPPWVKAVSSRT